MKKLTLIELNEINLDIADSYIEKLNLEGFKKLKLLNSLKTNSEKEYELLEPWIQWHSIHTGLSAQEHELFRLGDITKNKNKNIFEHLDSKGLKIGVISAMNILNNFEHAAFFIPDPWTSTHSGETFWEKKISKFLNQTVNDNSKNKIRSVNYLYILLTFLRFARFKNYLKFFKLAFSSFKKPWRKALFLDLLLSEVFFNLLIKHNLNFGTLFLNGGAHIQHHYFFNCSLGVEKNKKQINPEWYVSHKYDPFAEMLIVYDEIIKEAVNLENRNLIVATGLTQELDDKAVFYYRPKNHEDFLNKIGINFKRVLPRMSRDFLIEFSSEGEASNAEKLLSSIKLNDKYFFLKPDNRGTSIFMSIGYDREIYESDKIQLGEKSIEIFKELSFVAIKNGKHSEKGYLFLDKDIQANDSYLENGTINVKDIFFIINDFFKKSDF